jgi:hypothetical protein
MTETKTHKGGCHCGAVTYEADIGLDGVIACNCSHCYAKGFQLTFTTPDNFRLLSGEDKLKSYRFNTHVIDHRFCEDCGVEAFAYGKNRDGTDAVAINIRTLTDIEPNTVEPHPFDGRHKL